MNRLTGLPVAQASMNIAATLGGIVGPMSIGALTKIDPVDGWRKFYVRGGDSSFRGHGQIADEELTVDSSCPLGSDRRQYLRRLQTAKATHTP